MAGLTREMLQRMLQPLQARISGLIARGLVTAVKDGTDLQNLQITVLAGETSDDLERFQQYGFTSVPHDDGEAEHLAAFLGGDRSKGVIFAVEDRRYRMKNLANGEVALYTDEGDYIHFKRGQIVKVKAGSKCQIDTPTAKVTGDLEVDGSISAGGDVEDSTGSMATMRSIYNEHTHGNPNNSPPSGVDEAMDGSA